MPVRGAGAVVVGWAAGAGAAVVVAVGVVVGAAVALAAVVRCGSVAADGVLDGLDGLDPPPQPATSTAAMRIVRGWGMAARRTISGNRPAGSVRSHAVSRASLLLAVVLTAALSASARAETVAVDDGVLVVRGDPGRDQIQILGPQPGLATVDVLGLGMSLTAGAGCAQAGAMAVSCDPAMIGAIAVYLGDGNDVLTLQTPLPTAATGDAGTDRFYVLSPAAWGSEGPVRLDGGPGDDGLTGGAKDDVLLGGPGDDNLNGRGGNDVVNPGPGRDLVGDLAGNDVVNARDGERDVVDCGPGADLAAVDPFDQARNCELGRVAKRRP